MKKLKYIGILLLILFSIGCTTVYYPVSSQQVEVTDNFAVIKNDSLLLIVSYDFWVKEPQELTDYFISFNVTIKNRTREKMLVKPSDLSLLDELGNQYDAVLPEEILNLLIPEEILFDQFSQFDEETGIIYENWRESKNNLLTESLNYGAILPQAQKSGFVFFPKLKSKNNSCQFIYKDFKIDFLKEK